MKKLNIILVFLLLGLAVNVFAQESNENDPAEPQSGRHIQQRNVPQQNDEFGNTNNDTTVKKHFTWIGFNAGLGLTDVTGDYQKFLGLQLGLKAMHFYKERVGFIFSINYERFTFMTGDWQLIFNTTGKSYKLDYLSLELMFALKISMIYIAGGVFYDFLIEANADNTNVKSYFNSSNYGAVVDIGFLTKTYFLGLKFKFGLSNMFRDNLATGKSYSVYLIGGYGFSL